jgi:septum formation protein
MPDLILASGSTTRQNILRQAGVDFSVEVSHVDEDSIKAAMIAEGGTATMGAENLGEFKARKVANSNPNSLVIGADQILSINDIWFDKPVDMDHARAHLKSFSGKTHFLHTSVSVLHGDQVLWHHNEICKMTMRDLSEEFISDYLDQEGEAVLTSVGAYRLEGLGAQLFSKIEGDFFTILGLPLLPLLEFLRNNQYLRR